MTKNKRFFEPWVPERYNEGINGKKILVLGASYYCNKLYCTYFSECTDREKKDSSKFDNICPVIGQTRALHNEPSCATGEAQVYNRFAKLFEDKLNEDENIWDYLAFTNYVQFFLPCEPNGDYGKTLLSDLSERDFEALIEVLQLLQPDIVITWGSVILDRVRDNNEYVYDKSDEELAATERYVCHMKGVPGVNHEIAMLNCYHPSYTRWYSNIDTCLKYLNELLK